MSAIFLFFFDFYRHPLLTTNPKLILSELCDFYTELYSNRDTPNHNNASDAFLDHCRLPTLNEDAKQIFEGVLTKAECFKLYKRLKTENPQVTMA